MTALLQQTQSELRLGIRLREDGDAGLLQDLCFCQCGRFGCEVSVLNAATRGCQVFTHCLQVDDRRLEAVLDSTQVAASRSLPSMPNPLGRY